VPSTDNLAPQLKVETTISRPRFRFGLRSLILFVFIIGAFSGLVVRLYMARETARQIIRTRMILTEILVATEAYHAQWRDYPGVPASGKVDVTFLKTACSGMTMPPEFLIKNNEAVDVWGNPLRIKQENGTLRIWSCGANGIDEDAKGDDVKL
jgi:hypothetical protein